MSSALRLPPNDPDAQLLRELQSPPPAAEAREALRYWLDREARLPWHRRAARREARAMALAWQERLRRAELAALGDGPLGRLALWLTRPRPRVGTWVRRALVAATAASLALTAMLALALHALFG